MLSIPSDLRSLLVVTLALLIATAASATGEGDERTAFDEKVREAMASPERTPEEVARDKNRKPVETLAFAGLTGDMDVLELFPGGGWYTRLLAPALSEEGSLTVWIGSERGIPVMDRPEFADVKRVGEDVVIQATDVRGIYALPDAAAKSLGKNDFDAVLTFRNVHNFTARARAQLNEAAYRALRPGGIYLVVDHTRRHMQRDDNENRRRIDPVLVIEEALAAGFAFDGWSDLHYRPDDELRYEVGRKSVTGNTDRFTLRFRKPR